MGTSVWFDELTKVNWGEDMDVDFFNVNVHKSLKTLGSYRTSSVLKNLGLYKKLKIYLNNTKTDLVLIPISQETIGFIKDSIFIKIAVKRADKVVLMLHGSNFLNWQNSSSSFVRKYTRRVLKRTDGMIVLGDKLKQLFVDYYHREDIYVVPNGEDYPLENKSGNNKPINLLYLSNLQPTKGFEDVLDAFHIVIDGNKEAHLTVVGEWRDNATKNKITKKIKEKNLPISFVGPAYDQDKWHYFNDADVFVFPPRAPEGHPLVIVEAMAAGLPIISTDQGAITESVIEGENGFIVEPENPRQIAEKMIWFIDHPSAQREMGKKSRELYENHFTKEKMIDNMKATFTKIIAKEKLVLDAIDYHDTFSLTLDLNYKIKKQFKDRYILLKNLIDKYFNSENNILDLGCGSGIFSIYLAKKCKTVLSIDASKEMLSILEENKNNNDIKNIEILEGFIPNILKDVDNKKYDGIFCSSVLEYIDNMDETLEILSMDSDKGSYFIVTMPNKKSYYRRLAKISFKLINRPRYIKLIKHAFELEDFKNLLENYGYEHIESVFFAHRNVFNFAPLKWFSDSRKMDLFACVFRKS